MRAALLGFTIWLAVPALGTAQQPTRWEVETPAERAELAPGEEARASALAGELRCPVCQGVSIQDSPSPLAVQMKELIRSQVAEGRTDDEIRAYFVGRYGEWVLLEPRASGFNLVVYLLPALALLVGGVMLVVMVRRWSGRPAGSGVSSGGVAKSGRPG